MKAAPTSELRFEQRVWHRIMHSDTLRRSFTHRERNKQTMRDQVSVTRTGHMRSARRAPLPSARDETQNAPAMECRA